MINSMQWPSFEINDLFSINIFVRVFHTLVLQQSKEMASHLYNLILDLVPLTDSQCAERLENNDGFTPLKLAANEGNIEVSHYAPQLFILSSVQIGCLPTLSF